MKYMGEDVDMFSQKKGDHNDSLSSIKKWEEDMDEDYEQLDEEEFYLSHKRSKIKSKHQTDYQYNPNNILKNYKSAGKIVKPQKINTVIENYQKREKTFLPNLKSGNTPRHFTKANEFIGLGGNI